MGTIDFVNCTPHAIVLNDGRVFQPSGNIGRVSQSHSDFNSLDICKQKFGEVEGLPSPQKNTYYIVSALVLAASDRSDLIAPATNHPDTTRNDKGHIVSVPGFVGK